MFPVADLGEPRCSTHLVAHTEGFLRAWLYVQEKGASCMCVLLEGSSALWVHRRVCACGLEPVGWFQRVFGDVLSHTRGQASSTLLTPNKLERWAGKFGGRRRRVGAAFVRMEITVSPIQSVALFPGDNCKTGLLVLKNS